MKTTDEFPRAMLDGWLAELGLVLREVPIPADPAASRRETPQTAPASSPIRASGLAPTNVAVSATSQRVAHNTGALGFYSTENCNGLE